MAETLNELRTERRLVEDLLLFKMRNASRWSEIWDVYCTLKQVGIVAALTEQVEFSARPEPPGCSQQEQSRPEGVR